MEDHETERHEVEPHHRRTPAPLEEHLVARLSLANCAEQHQEVENEPRDEDAAEFPQDEEEIGRTRQPPVRGRAWTQPSRAVPGGQRSRPHDAPRGMKNDFSVFTAASSLYRWIAPAGSTFF